MPSLRTITGTILRPDGSPWRGARVTAQLVPGSFTAEHTFPAAFVQAVAGPDGSFEMELWANAEAESASVYRIKTPDDDPFEVVVPEGSGPLTLSELRQLGVPSIDPQYKTIQDFLVENALLFGSVKDDSIYFVSKDAEPGGPYEDQGPPVFPTIGDAVDHILADRIAQGLPPEHEARIIVAPNANSDPPEGETPESLARDHNIRLTLWGPVTEPSLWAIDGDELVIRSAVSDVEWRIPLTFAGPALSSDGEDEDGDLRLRFEGGETEYLAPRVSPYGPLPSGVIVSSEGSMLASSDGAVLAAEGAAHEVLVRGGGYVPFPDLVPQPDDPWHIIEALAQEIWESDLPEPTEDNGALVFDLPPVSSRLDRLEARIPEPDHDLTTPVLSFDESGDLIWIEAP